jgi:cytochrome c551/c552
MRLRFVWVVLTIIGLSGICWSAAPEGAAQFDSLKCGMCHKPDKKAAAISLSEIAKAYKDRDTLMKFFKGEARPLIESDKWGMMRGQLHKIKALEDPQKEALADYILSFK